MAVLGDSLAAGYGVPLEASFPSVLERELRAAGFACAVINAGVSGDTSAGGAQRVGWVLQDDPSHLIVELGGNDGLRALPVPALRRNLSGIVQTAQRQGVAVMLAGMEAPPNLGREYTDAFRAAYTETAEEFGVPLYPFFLAGAIEDPALMQPDGIHPNGKGVEVIVAGMLPSILDWLEGTGVTPG